MPVKHCVLPFVVALAVLAIPGCATAPAGPAEWDGLVRQSGTRLDAVFLKPDAEIPSYSDIILAPASVRFARNWDPNRGGRGVSRRLDSDDILAIQDNLGAMIDEIFREELQAGGHQIVSEPGPDTLLVVPAIVDLFIAAPEITGGGLTRTYTANPGRMTLVLELRDSVTGETLARVVDSQSARTSGMMNIANRVTNTADARRIIRGWAQTLRNGLESLSRDAAT